MEVSCYKSYREENKNGELIFPLYIFWYCLDFYDHILIFTDMIFTCFIEDRGTKAQVNIGKNREFKDGEGTASLPQKRKKKG
jgi:hypothetical protein